MSNKRILKFTLPVNSSRISIPLELPAHSTILSVQHQYSEFVIWVLASENTIIETYLIDVYWTGDTVSNCHSKAENYISTVQDEHGLVWHFFKTLVQSK